ncbi:hypothetical protein IB236_05080 [Acidovorax sp. ACV02]|uniref:hypothetical protein n=1 Tax=Acidovorax sp. ACV02 TaxID=2769310 RepID=UPI0017870AD0|nr:hypothetical protein [Acidovorax sp. ACV02]MBD9404692.1 hypothetical protein [Acidovorax sp. ACV02]
MGMFGPTNEEFLDLKNEINQLNNVVDRNFREIRSEIERSATASEAEARAAAESSIQLEEAARAASTRIGEALSEIDAYRNKLIESVANLDEQLKRSSESEEELREKIASVDSLHDDFIARKEGIDASVNDLSEKIVSANEFLEKSKKLPDAVEEVEGLIDSLNSLADSAKNILGNVVARKSEVDKLHKEIYGEDIDDSDGNATHINGLKDDLESAYHSVRASVDGLENSVEKTVELVVEKHEKLLIERRNNYEILLREAGARYEKINSQITGLLPGAMAEGLSAAYEKKKEAEEVFLQGFEKKFSYAIYGLVAISMIPFAVDIYLLAFEKRALVDVVKETPSLIIAIFPIYFPVLWLAYSVGKKAKLSKRLIEEYTHKSVLGKTFSGLSNQIETLQHQGAIKEELRTKLLFNVLQVSAENPGKLITDYKKSDHPLMDALEKSGRLSDSLDALSKIPGLSSLAKKIAEKGGAELKLQEKRVEAGLAANEKLTEKGVQEVEKT